MSSSRGGETFLSGRLGSIRNHYQGQRFVWDIGCDHGHLGLSFREEERVEEIHLVDPSRSVIEELNNKLKDSYITKPFFIHHQKGQEIKPRSESNIVFVAGMGGKEIRDILLQVQNRLFPGDSVIVSPHRGVLELREMLFHSKFSLVNEEVVEENEQFYPILSIRVGGEGPRVSLYGERLWEGEIGNRYLNHQIRHFQGHQDEASRAYFEYLKGLTSRN